MPNRTKDLTVCELIVCKEHNVVYTEKALGRLNEVIRILKKHGVTSTIKWVKCDCVRLIRKAKRANDAKDAEKRYRRNSAQRSSNGLFSR